MSKTAASEDTTQLELSSLQLDVKTLQNEHVEDRREFLEFSTHVQANFANI
jgi:hypothetical protein